MHNSDATIEMDIWQYDSNRRKWVEAGKKEALAEVVEYLESRIKGHWGCRGLLSTCVSCITLRQAIAHIQAGNLAIHESSSNAPETIQQDDSAAVGSGIGVSNE